jgi:ubiquinone/menaquinone biosynthesis C-methylase UbiE
MKYQTESSCLAKDNYKERPPFPSAAATIPRDLYREQAIIIAEKKMSNFAFKMMVLAGIPIRNIFMPPDKMLAEIEIKPGSRILDFGCGPGVFTTMIAEKIGPSGMIYALDINPLAVGMVERKARRKNLGNVRTIRSNCDTALPDNCLDYAIFFDVFHALDNHQEVLSELYRVLKPEGIMHFSDHHLKEIEILQRLTAKGLFKLKVQGRWTFSFSKAAS